MKTKTIFSALLTGSFLLSVSAFAQSNDRYYPKDNNYHQNVPQPVRMDNHRQDEKRVVYIDNRAQNMPQQRSRWHNRQDRERTQEYYYNGNRYDDNYRGQRYVVSNWREHNLSAPPRGYHWVQSGSDFLLAAIANNIIMQILHR